MTEMANVPDDTYIDGKRAARATEMLKQLANDKEQPFFLAVGFTKPHLPFVAPKKYWDLYERESFSMPPNSGRPPKWPEDAAFTKANEMQRYVDYVGDGPKDFPQSLNKKLLHGYAAAASFVDANVGRVLDALDEKGLSDNTIVVLWGDHGWKLGDHSSWCKHTNFECDTRVPLIVRDPRRAAGQETNRLVELIDLYPTLCDLTGIAIPGHCQGEVLLGCSMIQSRVIVIAHILRILHGSLSAIASATKPFGTQNGFTTILENYEHACLQTSPRTQARLQIVQLILRIRMHSLPRNQNCIKE